MQYLFEVSKKGSLSLPVIQYSRTLEVSKDHAAVSLGTLGKFLLAYTPRLAPETSQNFRAIPREILTFFPKT